MTTRWRVLLGVLVLVLVVGAGLFLWVRSVLSGDAVQRAVAAQLSRALGQPVSIGSIGAGLYPRVTMRLGDVRIGEPARITISRLDVGTDLRALVSRRIEHATAALAGVRIELPLPAFSFGASTDGSAAPVEIVSIDRIVLSDVEIVSGGRTLQAEAALVPAGDGATIERLSITAADTTLDVTGRILDLNGPTAELDIEAGTLDFTALLPFVGDFARGATRAAEAAADGEAADDRRASGAEDRPGLLVNASLRADRARFGALALDTLEGRARVTADAVALEPLRFGVFAGTYEGPIQLTLGRTPAFRVSGAVNAIDMSSVMAFAGSPGIMTGRLAGRLDISGRGVSAPEVLSSAAGTARVDITNGSVKGLGLLRSVVVATSMRTGARADFGGASGLEPFERLGTTLAIARGIATTTDLRFESADVFWSASGSVRLDGTAIDLAGPLQLSEALSKEAGRDLLRYTNRDGRVTLPAHVTGSVSNLSVRIDLGDALKRAITNRAVEEAKEAIGGALRGILR
jgi:uncharacterized protein involved in outer membrane biogenesis